MAPVEALWEWPSLEASQLSWEILAFPCQHQNPYSFGFSTFNLGGSAGPASLLPPGSPVFHHPSTSDGPEDGHVIWGVSKMRPGFFFGITGKETASLLGG